MNFLKHLIWFPILFISLVACTNDTPAIPTSAAVAQLPTNTPLPPTSLPPTLDLNALNPTQAPTVPPTRPPTTTPTPTTPWINISFPREETAVFLGDDIQVSGLVQVPPRHTIALNLRASNGDLLANAIGTPGDIGWEGTLTAPPHITGLARIEAAILDENGNSVAQTDLPIRLQVDTEKSGRYLDLYRPLGNETAVAGYLFFFDGRAEAPVGGAVTLSIWAENCQTNIGQFQVAMNGSGYWQGFVGLQRNAPAGPGCAIASFGTPGEETWRQAIMPITILPFNDSDTNAAVANPAPNSDVIAGQDLFLNGTAAVSEEEIQLSILLNNDRVIASQTLTTDVAGYWEHTVFIPIDAEGEAQITILTEAYENNSLINILPAPTPTPNANE